MVECLLIRADAGRRIGTGHAMRCLALAQTYRRTGGQVVFAMAESTQAIEKTVRAEGCEVTRLDVMPGSWDDAEKTLSEARARHAGWVIADGYYFDAAFQKHFKESNQRLMLLDDYGHAEQYFADLVVNQNLGASAELYRNREAETQLMLGPRYCLLRDEFLKWRGWKRTIPREAKKILITLGGSDPDNVTGKVLEAVRTIGHTEIVVVVGGSNPHADVLRTVSGAANNSIQVIVNASNMPELMAAADLAVTASGTTVWEAAFMGLPALTIVLAPNQQLVGDRLRERGVTRNLGWHSDLAPPQIAQVLRASLDDFSGRMEMSRQGRALVDGRGGFRLWLHLHKHALALQNAETADSHLIWEWANHPSVRAVSFSSAAISWQDHVNWFKEKVTDPHCYLWIARDKEGEPVGQVRFDVSGDEAWISVSLDAACRGRALGPLLIWVASRRLFFETDVELIHAYVKPENEASRRAFEKAGYAEMPRVRVKEQAALHFQFPRAEPDL